MFTPKTEKVRKLATLFPRQISDLDAMFDAPTGVYVDWANVFYWQKRLKWNIDIIRFKELLDSFPNVKAVKFYFGTLEGDLMSDRMITEALSSGYVIRTKDVKLIKIPINISSISSNSPAIIKDLIRGCFVERLDIRMIELLNEFLSNLNKQGIFHLEDKKCNFDVEIGWDMLSDLENTEISNFVLMSGDSDFADPVKKLKINGNKIILFSTSKKVTDELNDTNVPVFDVRKIREFICWNRDLPQSIKTKIQQMK